MSNFQRDLRFRHDFREAQMHGVRLLIHLIRGALAKK
jgi:hypothetical protein